MARRIAIFGGSFNPPGLHHRMLVERLAQHFDRVHVVPCGPRPDKQSTNEIPSVYRAALAGLTFGGVDRAQIDLFDLEQPEFTRSWALEDRYQEEGEVWHVVGADLIQGGGTGESEIQTSWENGARLWKESRFFIFTRPGHELSEGDLPPKHELMALEAPGSSTEIRERIERGASIEHLVPSRALAYLLRYGLYRAPVPSSWARGSLERVPFERVFDAQHPRASEVASQIPPSDSDTPPHFITTIGGDGSMLRCIRERWRERLPFFGINAGHVGFLMNAPEQVMGCAFPPSDVIFRQLPMLYLELETTDGAIHHTYGFNDAWLERSTSQSAWLEVEVNGVTRLAKLVSDGALVATAAGSTAYARSMGASPLLADTPAWLLVGSNVMEPANWRSALLSVDSTVEIRCLEPKRRPVEAFVDGHSHGAVVRLRARLSRAAAAELVFCSSHDMAEKIATIQFSGASR